MSKINACGKRKQPAWFVAPAWMKLISRRHASSAVQRIVSFSLGAKTRRVLGWALGFGSSRKRVWHHAKSPTPTSSKASERPHGQANSKIEMTRYVSPAWRGTGLPVTWFGATLTHRTRSPGPTASLIAFIAFAGQAPLGGCYADQRNVRACSAKPRAQG